ncbi:helix-turn-helix transcriptional regulator [Cupriavidus taiwanensis]|uniref:helix-turn-helix transcriptional regulator n=1 Tax=Cupriavidus taiwanensis TaxID=164546 RepID=UPI000400162A|nr:AlpA family phage regulatory protein [Cupriavidus taiwanensis]SOZ01749.1 hypothetical protein CBM2595_A30582 [Cupriavidus taiwanensis]
MPIQTTPNAGKRLPAIPLESLSIDLQGDALLTVRETMRRTGLAYSSLYEAMRLRGFPRPVKVGGGRTNRWVLREVDNWIAARIAARDATAAEVK